MWDTHSSVIMENITHFWRTGILDLSNCQNCNWINHNFTPICFINIETIGFNYVNLRIQLHWGNIRKCSCFPKIGDFWLMAAENAKQMSHLFAIYSKHHFTQAWLDNSKNSIQPQASAEPDTVRTTTPSLLALQTQTTTTPSLAFSPSR